MLRCFIQMRSMWLDGCWLSLHFCCMQIFVHISRPRKFACNFLKTSLLAFNGMIGSNWFRRILRPRQIMYNWSFNGHFQLPFTNIDVILFSFLIFKFFRFLLFFCVSFFVKCKMRLGIGLRFLAIKCDFFGIDKN